MSRKLGDVLQDIRIENNYTQTNLAELFGISRNTLSRWENNHLIPEPQYLDKYIEIFELPKDYFLQESWDKDEIPLAQINSDYICNSYYDISPHNAVFPAQINQGFDLKINLNPEKQYYVVVHPANELSTYPFILEKDIVFVEATSNVSPDDIIVVKHKDKVAVRKIKYVDTDKYKLEPLSPMFPSVFVDKNSLSANDYEVLGVIKKCIREFVENDRL